MGIVIGIFLIPFGLLIRDTRTYFFSMLGVFGLVLLTTLLFGVTALAISFFIVSPAMVGEISDIGNHVSDRVAFVRAGMMHNSSYAGGLVGILVGMTSILRCFLRSESKR